MRIVMWHVNTGAVCARKWPVLILALLAGLSSLWPAVWPALSVGLDAGHGGIDPGAIGHSGLQEKVVTLRVARMVSDLLLAEGDAVILTRVNDKRLGSSQRSDLRARVQVANQNAVDILLSIHCNGYHISSVHGPRTYYQPHSPGGRLLANAVQQRLRAVVGYGQIHPVAEDHLVTRESSMTAVVVELGYITNPSDEHLLGNLEFQRKLARAIVDGVRDYASGAGLT